jgi:hypothetical protein
LARVAKSVEPNACVGSSGGRLVPTREGVMFGVCRDGGVRVGGGSFKRRAVARKFFTPSKKFKPFYRKKVVFTDDQKCFPIEQVFQM